MPIIEHYLDEDRKIRFYLQPETALMDLLPPHVAQQARDMNSEAGVEFYLTVDCETMDRSISAILFDVKNAPQDLFMLLPKNLDERILAEASQWCKKTEGKDIETLASDHLKTCIEKTGNSYSLSAR